MILTPHILVGATIGAKIHNLGLIIILSILFHFVLDKIPHWDYSALKQIKEFKKNKKIASIFPLFIKMAIDGLTGLLIFLIALWNKDIFSSNFWPFIFLGIFISVLPDIILGSSIMFLPKKISKAYNNFHEKYLHFKHKEKEGEITFLGLITQFLVIIICVFLLNL